MSRINGWDERDYKLWSAIRCLPSYGLVSKNPNNPMLSRKDVLRLIEIAANRRFENAHKIAS
jgi:hypothetical protein